MIKRVFTLFMITVLAVSLVACGKSKDTGIIVSANDSNNDSGQNKLTDETNDEVETEVIETETEVIETTVTDNTGDDMEYITSGFVSEEGDVYEFNVDGTYSCYIVGTDTSSIGTYETDGKTYITLKCTQNNSGEEEESVAEEEITSENYVEPAYTTKEPGEDGKTIVTDYDESGNILNQYILDKTYESNEESDKDTESDEDKDTVLDEITYKLTKTTTTDEYENVIEVVILSKGDTKIVLQKQFELN